MIKKVIKWFVVCFIMKKSNYFPKGAYIVDVLERQVTFVGTNHLFRDLDKYRPLKIRLANVFRDADHIMVEGCAPWPRDGDAIQAYARSFCSPNKPLIESEAGVDYASLLANYGCKPHLLGAWIFLNAFNFIMDRCPKLSQSDNERFNDELLESVDSVLSLPSYNGIDFQQSWSAGYNMIKLVTQKKSMWGVVIHFGEWFHSVRDYCVFKKRTEELAALVGCLRGRPLPDPASLDCFLSTLDPEISACLTI